MVWLDGKLVLPVLFAGILVEPALAQEEAATPEEVIQKVEDAADYLAGSGDSGLQAFQSRESPYVWKDSYVVVNDCEKEELAAHPIRPELAGAAFADAPSFGGVSGARVGAMLCEAGRRPRGGWVEYPFPKPGDSEPSRKLSYAKAVEGTSYVLNAGIYSEEEKIEDLEALLE